MNSPCKMARVMGTGLAVWGLSWLLAGTTCPAAESSEVLTGNGLDHARLRRDIIVLDEFANRRINEIGQNIAKQAGRADLKFTFRIVNDPQVNAFATSGGFVYINTGLLDFCDSEGELAAVIAHEVTHISERHLLNHLEDQRRKAIAAEVEKLFIQLALQAAGAAAGGATGVPNAGSQMGNLGSQVGQLVGFAVIDPATQASILGYKRDQELEADRRGVKFMKDAGYDPHAMVKFFDKMDGLRAKLIANHEPLACGWINKQPGLKERASIVKQLVEQSEGSPQPGKTGGNP